MTFVHCESIPNSIKLNLFEVEICAVDSTTKSDSNTTVAYSDSDSDSDSDATFVYNASSDESAEKYI